MNDDVWTFLIGALLGFALFVMGLIMGWRMGRGACLEAIPFVVGGGAMTASDRGWNPEPARLRDGDPASGAEAVYEEMSS